VSIDLELAAMQVIADALKPLPHHERVRVVQWARARFLDAERPAEEPPP
jgi:hypothetical protein